MHAHTFFTKSIMIIMQDFLFSFFCQANIRQGKMQRKSLIGKLSASSKYIYRSERKKIWFPTKREKNIAGIIMSSNWQIGVR